MNKIIGVTELQRNFRTIFDQVAREHASYILTRGSRPEAVMVPYDLYVKFIQGQEEQVLRRMDETLAKMARVNAHYTDEEVERDVEEASRIVRARRHARESRAAYKPKAKSSRKTKK